ncbi:dipicolinate synthase subunit A [Thermodesulfitimonas autotrophica]|uniref:Dipicolinate synthase subunit A n=1 Tax=Thermodesulfitimonas autotrophica TaxID=1894989 RepID=A0A3N5BB35_9THEO|nr:dipicolinate synthase subunit DpsA [Thermodesulfitimonas autotrophica]RPF46878.1 dipicolinate synthase subunit A [Thermodesulfitimonas autotrophica]
MKGRLRGITVSVVGGDHRAVFVAEEFLKEGAQVRLAGHEVAVAGVQAAGTVEAALRGANAVVFPLPGVSDDGYVATPGKPLSLSEEDLAVLSVGTPVFTGFARKFLREVANRRGLKLVEIAERDDFAILNAIPSAEGAIQLAMEHLPVTIHGSAAFVLGFGRVGMTLARMLTALGARTTVVARDAAQRARAMEMGCRVADFGRLPVLAGEADVIFNTVPALVLTAKILKATRPDVLIIDLATRPGGTDFDAAQRLKRQAILAPSLPGRVAPKTAGRIFAQVVADLLVEEKGLALAVGP